MYSTMYIQCLQLHIVMYTHRVMIELYCVVLPSPLLVEDARLAEVEQLQCHIGDELPPPLL